MSGDEFFDYDVFISHASEDKDDFVRPLAEALRDAGVRVWYDEWTLVLGDRLRRRIDEGLKRSRFGVVVLSQSFFAKKWPQDELDGLVSLEGGGVDRILPVWHSVDRDDVASYSPTLADRVAARSRDGVERVVSQIAAAVARVPVTSPLSPTVSRARRKSVVDARLRARNLVGGEGERFGENADTASLKTGLGQGTAECRLFAVLSLVPIGSAEELDPRTLLEWVRRTPPSHHPLFGEDTRPRGDGVIVRRGDADEGLTRYTFIAGDGYVEWGRALGGRWDNVCILRLGPLLWAVSHLYDFLAEFKSEFGIRSDYDLVVSIPHAKDTCLTHLGEGWLEIWTPSYSPYMPRALDDHVQFRQLLPASLGAAARRDLLIDIDRYLNQAWGAGDSPRGHHHPDGEGGALVLNDEYRERDPWAR